MSMTINMTQYEYQYLYDYHYNVLWLCCSIIFVWVSVAESIFQHFKIVQNL